MLTNTLVEFGAGISCRVAPGPGEKLLWIHGYTMDSSLWSELWRYLPDWHHIGIDLPFHGSSPGMPAEYDMSTFAQLVGEHALKHGVKHLVGLSLGAILTLQVAMEFPDSFLSVTLGSAGLSGGPNDPHAGPHYRRLMALYRQQGPGPWMTKQWMQWPPDIFKGAAAHPSLWQRLVDVIDGHTWDEFNTFFMGKLTNYHQMDHLDKVGRIQAPTLLVVGENEMPAFKQAAAILADTIPQCECVYLPQAGHLCLLEQPVAAARLIHDHLIKRRGIDR